MSDQETPTNPQVRSPHNPRVMMAKNQLTLPPMPFGWDDITKFLPHRYPMLLVDKITELEPGHRAVGFKNITATEEYFQGHFPGHPVMPGVLLLESMAQVAGVLILVTRNTPGALSYFATVEKARFRQPVRPGDCFVTEATLQVLRGPYCRCNVIGRVDGQVVAEGDYTFMTTGDTEGSAVIIKSSGATGTGYGPTQAPLKPEIVVAAVPAPEPAASKAEPAPETSESAPRIITPAPMSVPALHAANGSNPRPNIHPTALVDPKAEIDETASVGAYCIVEAKTKIGAGTVLEPYVMVKSGTSIGRNCRIMPHCVLGHEPQDLKFKGEETYLRIGDNNVLRELVTLHRATGEGEATIIGDNNMLMAYVHLGHNCVVGNNNMISNSAGISGHVTIEDRCVIGGFVGIHQFVHIGKMAMVGGLSKVVQDVPPFCIADGRPARIHGLNTRGLRRNGVTSSQRNEVGAAFKLLYRSDLNTTQALNRIAAEIPQSETLEYLTNFIERVREGRLGRQDETPHL